MGHVATTFGIALLGAIECPVNAGLRGEALQHVLYDSGAEVLIIEGQFIDRIEDVLEVTRRASDSCGERRRLPTGHRWSYSSLGSRSFGCSADSG